MSDLQRAKLLQVVEERILCATLVGTSILYIVRILFEGWDLKICIYIILFHITSFEYSYSTMTEGAAEMPEIN